MRSFLSVVLLVIALGAALTQPHHHTRDDRAVCALCGCAHAAAADSPARPELPPRVETPARETCVIREVQRVALLDAPKQGPPEA